MKIRKKCAAPDNSCALKYFSPNQTVRMQTGVSDIFPDDPCVVVDLRSYDWHLADSGCEGKVAVLNLRTSKLSMLNPNRKVYKVEVEVCLI